MQRILLAVLATGLFAGAATAANPVVVMETSMGTIKVELFADKAPGTVKNFLQYVADKHYDGTIFHRVIPTFMVQGGGFESGMKEKKTRDPIKNESGNGLSNVKGTLAMARTPKPDSATSQFFINVKDNGFLDRANADDGVGYCVFGKVVEGMDVVDKIKAVKTGNRSRTGEKVAGPVGRDFTGHQAVPEEDVVIKSVKVVQ
jgi:cyclophilin family peptidyl-prolyl cis-trans isomerase